MRRLTITETLPAAKWLLLAVLSLPPGIGLAQLRPEAPVLCVDSSTGCGATAPAPSPSGSYPLYPSLDLQQIPWHTGSGAWGPQVRLEAPAVPSTTRSVTVNSRAEFNSAAAVPRTQITIGTSWAGNTFVDIDANDIDVIIPRGISIGGIVIGTYGGGAVVSRVRVRGPSPGTHSGGRMGQLRTFTNTFDIIIDGIDMNGDSGFTGAETNTAFRVDTNRLAVLNSRVIAAGPVWLGKARHVVIANSNLYHGAASRTQLAGFVEGWGIRNAAGPIVIVDSRIQGTRYYNIRVHSEAGAGEHLYVKRSTLVAVSEGRSVEMWNDLPGAPDGGIGHSGIIEDSTIYAYTAAGCAFGPGLTADNVRYSRVSRNRFFSSGNAVITQAYLNSQSARTGDHNWTVGNTFAQLVSLPAWTGPGNPTQLPLPGGLPLNTGEAPCTSF